MPSKLRPSSTAGLALPLVALLSGLFACAPAERNELVVLAAASLSEALRELAADFEERQGTRVLLSLAGSQTLATQLRAGVDADVIALADPLLMQALADERLVATPQPLASNRVVWIFSPEGAPAAPDDLIQSAQRNGWRVVLAAPEVPAGRYALEALDRMGLREVVLERVVSFELDVKGVLAKVQLGVADAGIVYASDVTAVGPGDLVSFEFPPHARVRAGYLVAVTSARSGGAAARAFLAYLRGERAQEVLRAHGFGPA